MFVEKRFSYFFFPTCFALVNRGVGERGLLWEVDLYDGPYIRTVIYTTKTHCIYLVGRVEVTRPLWLLSVAFIMLVRYFLRKSYIYPNIGITFTVEIEMASEMKWRFCNIEDCIECNLILPYERVLYYGTKSRRALIRFFYYMGFKVFIRCVFRRLKSYKSVVLVNKRSINHIFKKYARLKAYYAKHKERLW